MPTPKTHMGDYLDQLEEILDRAEREREEHYRKMHEQRKLHDKQLSMYKETLDKSIEFSKERIEGIDRRVSRFVNVSIFVLSFIIVPFIIGGFTVNTRLSKIEDYVREQDPAQKTEVTNSLGVVIDETRDALEGVGMDKVDGIKYESDTKSGITRAMGDISRGNNN